MSNIKMLMKRLCAITFIFLINYCLSPAQEVIQGEVSKGEIVYDCAPCGCADDGKYFSSMGQCPSCNMTLRPTILGIERENRNIKTPTVGILIFNMADVMDVSGPISVFEHAGLNVVTFAKTADPVRIGMTLELKPDYTIENLPEVDILVFPGGGMAESNPGDKDIVNLIKGRYDATDVLFSVCSGAFFLGEAGVLDHQRATTFASMIPMLAEQFPGAIVLDDVKYTDNGKIVTSAGLSSGIDAAFHVVAKFYGIGRAQDIANHMEYPWKRANDYARSQLADNFILDIRSIVALFSKEYFYSQGDYNQWEYRYAITDQIKSSRILNLIQQELGKKENWKTQKANKLSINGIVTHGILGKGGVQIIIEEDPQKGKIARVVANRLQNYNP